MDSDDVHEASSSVTDDYIVDGEVESSRYDILERFSSKGESVVELENAGEVLTRLELDLARSSEKLVNLGVLLMYVATMESEFESLASDKDHALVDSAEKALDIDLLSGILDSEVMELDNFMATIENEIVHAHELKSSWKHSEDSFLKMEEKLLDCEKSLKQSQDQVSEIRMQAEKLQTALSCYNEENWNGQKNAHPLEDDQLLNMSARIKMQTGEQQRNILRMLEKSLAREMDTEKKLTESRQLEEELKLRLHSSEQDLCSIEEEVASIWERYFEADNASDVLAGVSKELLGRIQIFQLTLNGSLQREAQLRSELEVIRERLKAKETDLLKLKNGSSELNDDLLSEINSLKFNLMEAEDELNFATSEVCTLKEKVSSLELQYKQSENHLLNSSPSRKDLEEKISIAESRAESAEIKCKSLAETNKELNEELGQLKSSTGAADRLDLLERQLRESDIKLQQAVASAEASQEKQSLLHSAITDMEHLIEDLKFKAVKEESRADSAEERCIILSESHAELNDELSYLRGRLNCLESSLHQAEKTKMATARDIAIQTKVITNLVMQLAMERERLHKKISSLALENKILFVKLQQANKYSSVPVGHDIKVKRKEQYPKPDLTSASCARGSKEDVSQSYAAVSELDDSQKKTSVRVTAVESTDFPLEPETARRIDAGLLNFKHLIMALLIVLISAGAYLSIQQD